MATKITNILVRTIVFFAVLGIIFLLTMYNARLLHTLNWFKTQNINFDWTVIIIASIAYSLGSITVVIWYNPTKKESESKGSFRFRYAGSIFLKLLFVIIDGIHVYVYNNTHIEDLASWLSPVYALQTAMILFFVGAIMNDIIKTGKEKEKLKTDNTIALESEIELKESKIKKLQSNIELLKSNIEDYQSEFKDMKDLIDDTKKMNGNYISQIEHYEGEIKIRDSKIAKYFPVYQKNEVSRIRKMKIENRTPEEVKMLEEYEKNQN